MKTTPIQKQYISNSSSTLISTLYNGIRPPTIPKCCACNNKQTQRQLQRKDGTNYFFIPDRHVDVFVCTFCKKLDQPKCTYCWDSKPCCTHREKTHVDTYFKTIKQDIIKTAQYIVETYKGYEKRSTDDISLSIGPLMTTESIKKDLTIHFYNVQDRLKKDVEDQMGKNYQQLYGVYQTFEQDLKARLNPQSNSKNANGQRKQTTKQVGFGIGSSRLSLSLQDCLKWLNQLQNLRQEIQKTGQQVCSKYINRMSIDYPKLLFTRMNQAFRQVLMPKVTFKDSMIQTVGQSNGGGSLRSIGGSEWNLVRERKEENAGPGEERLGELQRVIRKDLETIVRLEERVRELEFILNIEQEKNQQLQARVLELQAQCGITHDERDVSMIDNLYGKKINQNKSYDFKSSLKSSRSNPTLLNQSEIIVAEERDLHSGKGEEYFGNGNESGNGSKEQIKQNEKQVKNVKYRKKSTESKGKGMMQNSAWLEEVVNEIKE